MCDCTSAGQTAFCCFIPELPWLSTSWPVTPLLRAAHDPAKGSIPTLRFQGENVTPGLPNINHSNSAGGRARQQQQILQMFRCFCPQWSFPAGIRCKQQLPGMGFAASQTVGEGPANRERKVGATSLGRALEGQSCPSCQERSCNGRAESANPAATATEGTGTDLCAL